MSAPATRHRAVLLVNLGSPASPSVADVRRYLTEFLSDDRVLDRPRLRWLRWLLVHAVIVPRRAAASARAYQAVWRPGGAPLLVTSDNLRALLQARVDVRVALAMRYGSPSIASTLRTLLADGVYDLLLVPLYPHYATSSWETVVVRVHEVARELSPAMHVTTVQPFYDDPEYVEALVEVAQDELARGWDHVLLSFHGLPERHLRQTDPSHAHCGVVADCCRVASPVHATCYRAQTLATAQAFVRRAGIPAGRWSVAYQSRLGGEPWMRPHTDATLDALGAAGVRRLLVVTPSFVSDCLETLEEIAITGARRFARAGGAELRHVPCLNESPRWIRFLADRVAAWGG